MSRTSSHLRWPRWLVVWTPLSDKYTDGMHWQLWDIDSGNMVGDYDSEADALAVVREAIRRHGPTVVNALALGAEHDDEGGDDANLPPIIRGAALVARVEGCRDPYHM